MREVHALAVELAAESDGFSGILGLAQSLLEEYWLVLVRTEIRIWFR
jgi:hypothetical protein